MRVHDSVEVREAVASNPSVLVEDLLVLKEDEEQEVQIAAYLNTKMPEKELRDFCEKAEDDLLSQILDGSHVTGEMLSIVLDRVDGRSNLSYKLANYKKMTPEHLDKLARKGNKYLAERILNHKELLPETVEFIAETVKGDWMYSQYVAKHPLCSEERMLSYCGKSFVEDKLLENPNITDKVLEKLAESGGYYTKRKAQEMLFERRKEHDQAEKGVFAETAMMQGKVSLDDKMKGAKEGLKGSLSGKVREEQMR